MAFKIELGLMGIKFLKAAKLNKYMPETTSVPSFSRQISAAGSRTTLLPMLLRVFAICSSDKDFSKGMGMINLFTKKEVFLLAK